MSLISYHRGQGSIILRVKILDSTASTGAGKTGLTNASSGLIISTIADNESAATAYTQAASHIQTIATLGTYAAPSASNCRFGEVDATNHKGVYEIQIADARYAVSSAKSLLVSVSGATGAADCDAVIPLTDMDPYDAVHGGMSALPNTACTTNASLLTSGTGTDQLSVTSGRIDVGKALGTAVTLDANNVLNVSTKYIGGTLQTARDLGASVLLSAGTGTGQLDFTSGVVKSNAVQWLGGTIPAVNVTGVPLVDLKYTLGTISPAQAGYIGVDWAFVANPTSPNSLSATTVGTVNTLAANAIANGSFQNNSISSGKIAASATAAIATAVWQDTTAGDFTVASSIGKSLFTTGAVPGASGGIAIVGSAMTLAASQHVIVDSGTVTTLTNLPAITAGWLTATGIAAGALNGKGDWLLASSYTAPTNLTAAQIATGIWQDTTAGDFTVAASIGKSLFTSGNVPGAASGLALVGSNVGAAASVTGAVGSVTGNVGGSVASVTSGVTLTANGLDAIAVTDPGAPANHTTIGKMLVAIWRTVFKKSTLTSSQLKYLADDGTTANATAAVSDDGTTQTKNAAS